MPRRRSEQAVPPTADRRFFTNREHEMAVYERLTAAAAGTPLPVVMFHGVGGAGKTWLLQELREKHTPDDLPTAAFDLSPQSGGPQVATDPVALMDGIRFQIAPDGDCPRYDLARAFYTQATSGGEQPKFGTETSNFLFELVVEGTAIANDTAIGSLVSSVVKKVGEKTFGRETINQWSTWLAGKTGQELFVRLSRMRTDPQALIATMRGLLRDDLDDALEERNHDGTTLASRAVLFFDNIESCSASVSEAAAIDDAFSWLRELHELYERRDQLGFLIVLGGRDRLRWAERFPGVYDTAQRLDQHVVGGLSTVDASLFLSKWKADDAKLRDAILRICRNDRTAKMPADADPGHHAYSLGLCVDIVVEDREAGRPTEAATFDLTGDREAELARRFLRSISGQKGYEAWLRCLSLTPRFDQHAAIACLRNLTGSGGEVDWEKLRTFSFVQPGMVPGSFVMHRLMRGSLSDSTQWPSVERKRAAHIWWCDYWQAEGNLPLSWVHIWRLDSAPACIKWIELATSAKKALRFDFHKDLLTWWEPLFEDDALARTRELADGRCACAAEVLESKLEHPLDGPRRAEVMLSAAESLYVQDGTPLDWASTLNNRGISRQIQGELLGGDEGITLLEGALDDYENALTVLTCDNAPSQWATTLNNRGNARSILARRIHRADILEAGIRDYSAALTIRTRQDVPLDWAMTLCNRGSALSSLGERTDGDAGARLLAAAVEDFGEALTVYSFEDTPLQRALTLNNRGNTLLSQGERTRGESGKRLLLAAIEDFDEALSVRDCEKTPLDWALTTENRGLVWEAIADRSVDNDRREMLERAEVDIESTLTVFDDGTPRNRTKAMSNLERIREKLLNLE